MALLLVLLAGVAQAQVQMPPLLLDAGAASRFDVAGHIEVLTDPGGQLDLAAVRSVALAQQFQPRDARLGFTAAAVWLRLVVHNPSAQAQTWWFDTGNRTLQELDLYTIDAQGHIGHQSASATLPFASRPLPLANFVFALALPAQQSVALYLRARSTGYLGVELHPVIGTPQAVGNAALTEKTQWIIYLAMATALGLVNLVLGLYLRDRAYLLYVACIVVWALAVSSISGGYGAAYELLWPDWPLLEQVLWVAATVIASVTVIFFTTYLLELPVLAPRATRWLWRANAVFSVAVGLQVGLTLLQRTDLAPLLQSTYLVGAVVYISMNALIWVGAISAALAGKRLAWYIMLANVPNSAYTVAVTVAASVNGHAPVFGAQFMWTSLFELFVMAFALADRFYQARAELLAVQASLGLRRDNAALMERLRGETASAQLARREAVQANLAKSKFLAAASHDLRQPIHALGLFLEVLACSGLNASQRLVLDKARSVFGTSSEMLNTLLDFSRIEAGVVEVQAVAFELQPLLNKIEIEMAPQADAKGLVYRTREAHGTVLSDPGLVELILRNLVSNAIRYTHQGGVLVGWRMRGQFIQLEVWDTGIGIAPEQQAEVFEEFHQLGNPERDRSKGLGLGLAIASGLARRIGSAVTLASRTGRGSVFRLRLPTVRLGAFSPVREKFKEPVALAGLRVLVIDDDAQVCAAMCQLLGSWGCHCQAVESISAALEAARTEPPEAVISDWRLRQNETGAQAIAALREALGPTLPALLITGDTAPERLRQARDSGIPLLHKPLQPEMLRQQLLELLGTTTAG